MVPFRRAKSWSPVSPLEVKRLYGELGSSVGGGRSKMRSWNDRVDEAVTGVEGNTEGRGDFSITFVCDAQQNGAFVADSYEGARSRSRSVASGGAGSVKESREGRFAEGGLSDERNDAIWEQSACLDTMFDEKGKNQKPEASQGKVRWQPETPLALDPPSKLIWSFLQRDKEEGRRSIDLDMELGVSEGMQGLACKPLSRLSAESEFPLLPKSPRSCSPVSNNDLPEQGTKKEFTDLSTFPANDHCELSNTSDNVDRHVTLMDCGQRSNDCAQDKLDGGYFLKQNRSERIEDAKRNGECSGINKASGSSGHLGKSLRLSSPIIARTKTKSRLVEPLSKFTNSNSSQQGLKGNAESSTPSGRIQKGLREKQEEEEEDPFKDIDLPDKNNDRWSLISLFQWAALLIITAGLVCSLTVPVLECHLVWGLELWKWLLFILAVFCGRLVSGWVMKVAVFLIERNFLLRKRVLYFVYGLRKGAQNCLWLGLVLLSWNLMFDRKVERSTKNNKALSFMTKLFECLLIGAVIWWVKTLLVKVLASSFHVNTYFDRIQDSIFDQYVLVTLLGPPLIEIQRNSSGKSGPKRAEGEDTGKSNVPLCSNAHHNKNGFIGIGERSQIKGNKKSGEIKVTDRISVEEFQKLSPKNVSAWNMKRLINLVRHPGLSTVAQTLDDSVIGEQDVEISSEAHAKMAAKKIFKNVAKPGFRYIDDEDLQRFMGEEEVSTRVLPLFECAKETGKVSKKALKNWVISVYEERRALAHSLNDTRTAVHELHRLISFIVAIIIVIISLLVLGIATTHVLLVMSSQFLLVVFVFGNTCKQIFEAIVFLFIMHPFDVGDRVIIDNVQMVVEEMKILSTVFLRFDNQKIYYPNNVLAAKPIGNFYRSPDMNDSFDFSIHISTPLEKIAELKKKIAGHIESNPSHWYPKHSVVIKEIEDLNRIRITLTMKHTMNFQNISEKWIRRSDLLLQIKKTFDELGIEYHLLPQAVQLMPY